MSATALQGSAQIIELSTDNSTWKSLVCVRTIDHTIEGTTNEVQTNCGVFIGVGTPKFSFTADCVCNALRDSSTEVSYKDCAYWAYNGTSLYYRYRNAASGSVTQGLAWSHTGQVILSKANLKADNGQVVTFTVDVQGQGTLTLA